MFWLPFASLPKSRTSNGGLSRSLTGSILASLLVLSRRPRVLLLRTNYYPARPDPVIPGWHLAADLDRLAAVSPVSLVCVAAVSSRVFWAVQSSAPLAKGCLQPEFEGRAPLQGMAVGYACKPGNDT